MSTLTSAQLHVKRSSTRLHAPPGGASSLSFGCGGLGTAEPAEEAPNKDEPTHPRPSSGRYAPSMTNFGNNNSNAPGGYPNYPTQQPDPAPYNNYAPAQQPYQYQAPYNPSSQGSYSYGNNNFSNPSYAHNNNNNFQSSRPPSSTPSSRSSARSSSSSSSWGSQPPLTSSKRDQNWEKKKRLWLARKNSSNGGSYDARPCTPSSTWSGGPTGAGMLDDSINPPSPLSKLMHQHAQQQQPPITPGVDYQRLGTASSTRSSSYTQQPYQPQQYSVQSHAPEPGYAGGASFSRAGLSTASSTASSNTTSRRQPPGGQCQWSLG